MIMIVTEDNTVLEGLIIKEPLRINANNVTLKNITFRLTKEAEDQLEREHKAFIEEIIAIKGIDWVKKNLPGSIRNHNTARA